MPDLEPDELAIRDTLRRELAILDPRPGGWTRVLAALSEPISKGRSRRLRWVLPTAAALVLLSTGAVLAAASGFLVRVVPGPSGSSGSLGYPTSIALVCNGTTATAASVSLSDARSLANFPILLLPGARPTNIEWLSFERPDRHCDPHLRLTYDAIGSRVVVMEGPVGGSIPVAVNVAAAFETTTVGAKQAFIHYADDGRSRVAAILWQSGPTEGNVVFDPPMARDDALAALGALK